jgi:branched-subunit amino acid transport protein
MTNAGFDSTLVWLLIVVLGVGTFALRLSFIQLSTWLDEFPPRVEQALGFIPAAILAALIFPELFPTGGSVVGTLVNPYSIAGGIATVVAWRTRNMMATILVGMAVLWGLLFAL